MSLKPLFLVVYAIFAFKSSKLVVKLKNFLNIKNTIQCHSIEV